jgi:hypothetical protein
MAAFGRSSERPKALIERKFTKGPTLSGPTRTFEDGEHKLNVERRELRLKLSAEVRGIFADKGVTFG